MTRVLMNLDVSRIDDLSAIISVLLDMFLEEFSKEVSMSPAKVKSIDRIPLAILLRELIPLAPSDHDPPNPIEGFSEIRWFSSSPKNVSC